jgi:hypothetical protein
MMNAPANTVAPAKDTRIRLDRDRRRLVCAVEPLLGIVERGADDGGAADRGGGAELEDADDRDRLQSDLGRELHVLADFQVLVVGQLRVDDHLARRLW